MSLPWACHAPACKLTVERGEDRHVKATWHGQVIADSNRTLEVKGYNYFPRQEVRMELLRAAPKTDADRHCPHGVQFYDIVDGTSHSSRAAWSYEAPQAEMRGVDHWIGFWEDVEVA
jgi:uncharacterized protein (DUF427 family)